MLRFTIDNLVLRDLTTTTPYILQSADGLEAPDYRLSSYDRPGMDGGRVSNDLLGARLVSLVGEIGTADVASYQAARSALLYAARPQHDSSGNPLATDFSFTAMDGTQYFFTGFVKSFKAPLKLPTYGTFIIQVYVPNPALYIMGLVTSGLISRPSGGGVVYPVVYPIIYTGATGGVATFVNSGTADTYPIIYIRGQVTNPSVSFGSSTMSLNIVTTDDSDVITIDMLNRTIVLNTASILYTKSADSSWFSLPSGTSAVRFSTSSAGDTGTMEVTAYSAVLGV